MAQTATAETTQTQAELSSVPTYDDLTAAFVWYERAKHRLESATRAKKSAKEDMDEALASLEALGKKIAMAQQKAHGAQEQADRENTVEGQMSLVPFEDAVADYSEWLGSTESDVHDGSPITGDAPEERLQLGEGAISEVESLEDDNGRDEYTQQLAHAASMDSHAEAPAKTRKARK